MLWDALAILVPYAPGSYVAKAGVALSKVDEFAQVGKIGKEKGAATVSEAVSDNVQQAAKSESIKAINSINRLPANQGYDSFEQLKKAIGPAGKDKHWHHIVEQSQIDKSGFSPQQIHNTSNIIAVDAKTHGKISGHYNSKQYGFTDGKSVRDWLAGQSFELQYEYGLGVLREFGVIE